MNHEKLTPHSNVAKTTATCSSYINMNPLDSILRDEKKERLKSWLGKIFKINIIDGRCLVGRFVCTDRDGNTILENTGEYTDAIDSKLNKTRFLDNNLSIQLF